MERKFRQPQKRKPKLADVCQLCKNRLADTVDFVKWYRDAPLGSYNIRWASLCKDCYIELLLAGDILPKPKPSKNSP